MTSSHHGPYDQGYTRATMAYTKRSDPLLACCYEAGADHNADEATRAVSALPAAVVRSATPSLQRSGLLCMAAGALSARQLPLTHNRLCDVAGQVARAIPEGDEEAGSGFYSTP